MQQSNDGISEMFDLLNLLKLAALSPDFSRTKVIIAMESVLAWLNRPENNDDSNCRQVDYFVCFEIMPEDQFQRLPEDIKGILFDMGAALHDTHTSPEIAENFESMPDQLLERVRRLESKNRT